LAPKEKRSKVLDAGFDANEALSMLINIQSSQDDKKFDLLDGFLDKYKVSHTLTAENRIFQDRR